MILPPNSARKVWFGVMLILAGLCHSRSTGAVEDSLTVRKVSEDALGFGEASSMGQYPPEESGGGILPGQTPQPSPHVGAKSSAIEASLAATKAGIPTRRDGGDSTDTTLNVDLLNMSREALFEKVFRKPLPPRLRELAVHLVVDNIQLESIRLLWDEEFQNFRFRSGRLQSYLDTALLPSAPKASKSVREEFSSQELKDRRFGVTLDETEFVLTLSVPPDLKKHNIRSLEESDIGMSMGTRIAPARFSAYLNSYWEENWTYREHFFPGDSSELLWKRYNGSPRPERQPLHVNLDGAVRTVDWVLMGSGSLREPDSSDNANLRATRNETKLVHDFVPWNSRLTLIDVAPRHEGGNYSIPNLLGVDFNMGSALFSKRRSERAKVNFFLDQPAEVIVLVNGDPVRSLRMGSGSQTIEGIPGRPGLNEGEVQIVYPGGRVERVPFQFTRASPEVLPDGHREGSLSAGLRRIGGDEYGTTANDLVVSGTYQQGLGSFLNGKVGGAASTSLQVANVDLLWIDDSVSTWNLVSTVSRDSSGGWGQRHDLRYSLRMPPANLLARASYIQSQFQNSFFVPPSPRKVAVELGLGLSRPVWKGALAFDLNAQFNRERDSLTNPIDYRLNLSYSLQAFRGLSFRSAFGFDVSDGKYSPTATLAINYFFNAGGHSFYAMNQTANRKEYVAPRLEQNRRRDTMMVGNSVFFIDRDTSSLVPGSYRNTWKNQSTGGWSWAQGVGMAGGRSLSMSGSVAEDQYGLQVGAQRTSNYADLAASYNLSDQNRSGMMSRSHYLSTRMSSSLMFADGVFAVGRPVRDGFVLVKGREALSTTRFRINPSDQNGSEYSRGGPWVAASYGMFSSYQTENIQVRPDHPPPGVFLDGNQFYTENTYQQGFVLRLGRPAQIFVRMRLIDEASQPLKHTTFRIYALSDSVAPLYRSFSNEDGTIQIGGLEPGKRYIIRFGEDAFVKDLLIAIPKNAPRMFDMGDQKVENQSLSQLSKISMLTIPAEVSAEKTGRPGVAMPPKELDLMESLTPPRPGAY